MDEKMENKIALRLATYFLCKNGAFAGECYTGGWDVSIASKLGFSENDLREFAGMLRQEIRETGTCFWNKKEHCRVSAGHEF